MSDYKPTLNLPKTDFPMKANLATREPEFLQKWESEGIYHQLRDHAKGRPLFVLHDGPPYANGDIHVGHATNKILKDMVLKFKALSGFDVPYIPGWDCHGLPIEVKVEKKVGKPGHKISFEAFREACRHYALSQVDIQRNSFKRLGIFGDWDNPYLTLNYTYEADIVRTLVPILKNGHLNRGYKPVHWCMDCSSALAEAEVEYQDKTSHAIDVRFSVIDPDTLMSYCEHSPEGGGEGPLSVVIWTTTPWTLPANQAVALSPEIDYVVLQLHAESGPERILIAESLVTDLMSRIECDNYRVVAYCKGDALEGVMLRHPFYDRNVPIVLGEHVTTDAGTGAVHTAPGHGYDDYVTAMRYDLPIDNPVDDHGKFYENVELVGGKHVTQVNEAIIDILQAGGSLVHHTRVTHSYPHCWRHKTPLIFRATPQWFVSLEKNGLREHALKDLPEVKWFPHWGEERIRRMIDGRPDWCISRQRTWGVPLPLITHKQTGELHPKMPQLIETIAEAIEKEGLDAWFNMSLETLIGNEAKEYDKSKDTLDVWYDSGVSHTCVLKRHPALHFPADLYLEGSDQHRGWFQSALLSSEAMYAEPPYKAVLTHGFTVDEQGRKMSKSLGNVISPETVTKTLGADILRMWVASTDYQGELSISDQILKRTSDVYRRIRNTARFLLSNIHDFDPKQNAISANDLLPLDRYAIEETVALQNTIQSLADDYQFHKIYQAIHHFCSVTLGSFYLDIIKDRQYTMAKESVGRRSAQTAMYHIIHALVRWLAPIISFTAEEIWACLPGTTHPTVFMETWYEGFPVFKEAPLFNESEWKQLVDVRDAVNKAIENARSEDKIGSALEAEVALYCHDSLHALLSRLEDELRFVLITSGATVWKSQTQGELTEIEGLSVSVIASTNPKCVRCWHRREDVGSVASDPELCGRCHTNVNEKGEIRQYA